MGKVHDPSNSKFMPNSVFLPNQLLGHPPQGMFIQEKNLLHTTTNFESSFEDPSSLTPKIRAKRQRKPLSSTQELKRVRSSLKERQRNQNLNDAFLALQKCVPYVPDDQRLVKIKTLRLAVNYIEYLKKILEGEDMGDFATEVMSEMQRRNAYKQRAEEEIAHSKQQSQSMPNSLSTSPNRPTTSSVLHNFEMTNFSMEHHGPLSYMQAMDYNAINFSDRNISFPPISLPQSKVEHQYFYGY